MWSDLVTNGVDSNITYGVAGTAPNRVYIIFYDHAAEYGYGDSGNNTLQIKLFENGTSSSNSINARRPVLTADINRFVEATSNSPDSFLFLNFSYSPADLARLNESLLFMGKYTTQNGAGWITDTANFSSSYGVDTVNKFVFANITDLGSIFAPLCPVTPPGIAFTPPTPDEAANTSNSTIPINISINEGTLPLGKFVFDWNGSSVPANSSVVNVHEASGEESTITLSCPAGTVISGYTSKWGVGCGTCGGGAGVDCGNCAIGSSSCTVTYGGGCWPYGPTYGDCDFRCYKPSAMNLTCGPQLNNDSVYSPDLVLMYNFDNLSSLGEGDGHVTDLSMYGNNATCNGNCPTWTPDGKYGGAFSYDGSDALGTNLDIQPSAMPYMTFVAWVYPTTTSGSRQDVFSDDDYNWDRTLTIEGGTSDWEVYTGDTGPNRQQTAPVDFNQWQQVAVIYTASSVTFYKNGVRYRTYPTSGQNTVNKFTLGKDPNWGDYFNGKIDEVRVYDRALSDMEIEQLYESNLNKDNASAWQFFANQPFASLPAGDHDFTYFACAQDDIDNGNCTETRNVTFQPIPPQIAFSQPTPDEATVTSNSTIPISATMNETSDQLSRFILDWNGTNRTLDVSDDLVLLYRFDNFSAFGEDGSHIIDSSMGGHDAECAGSTCPTWTPAGVYGGAMHFNGSQYALVRGNFNMNQMTVSAWINKSSYSSGWMTIFHPAQYDGWGFGVDSGDHLYLQWHGHFTIGSAGTITDNTWHQVALTYDGYTATFYIDGVQVGIANPYSPTFNGAAPYVLGCAYDGENSCFNGTMDDVRIYNRSLTADEMQQLYESSPNKYGSGAWQFSTSQPFGSLPAGDYNFTYSACAQDTAANENCTETRNITHHVIPPQIAFAPPTPDEGTNTSGSTVPINISINETSNPLTRFILDWNGTNRTLDPTDDLVLLYHFDNLSALGEDGSHVADASMNGHDAVCSGSTCPTWTPSGKYNGAFHFDGVDDYFTTGNLDMNIFSVSAWIKLDTTSFASGKEIIDAQNCGGWELYVGPDNTLWLADRCIDHVKSAGTINDTQWHNIVVTDDGYTVRFYIDGASAGNQYFGYTFNSGGGPYTIGGLVVASDQYFPGKIDELRVYNRSLLPSEVGQLYLSNLDEYDAGTWQFSVNQPFGSLPAGYYNFTYSACVQDSAADTACTETRNITLHNIGPDIAFSPPTPADGNVTSAPGVPINISINETLNPLGQLTYDWNNTNYTPYDGNLVLMYNFDNVSALGEDDSHVTDVSMYGNNATCSGSSCPAWTPDGVYGGAYVFDGVDDQFNANNLDDNQLTVSTWIKLNSTSRPGYQGLIASGNCNGWSFFIWPDNTLVFSHTCVNTIASTGTITDTDWHQVVMSYNGSTATFYIDGNPAGSQSYNDTFNSSGGQYLIGAGVGSYFQGSMDELRVYNRSLSAQEVMQLYESNLDKYDTNKWQFSINQSFDVLSGGDHIFTYSGCAQDINGHGKCTETRHITSRVFGPAIAFSPPTPPEAAFTSNSSILVNISVNETRYPLGQLTYDWNGTNYTPYDGSLVLMYDFDNVSALGENDSHVTDVSMYGNNATCSGSSCPAWTSDGVYGGAYHFDGVDDNFTMGNLDHTPMTVSTWIKRDRTSVSGGEAIIYTHDCNGWGLGIAADNTVFFDWACNVVLGGSTGTVADSDWHQLTVTYDGSTATFYIDGAASGSASSYNPVFNSAGGQYLVGGMGFTGFSQNFQGTIDEIRVYNRTLSASEIQQLYESNLNKYDAGKWQFSTNQSFGSLPFGEDNLAYYGCAQDINGAESCTEERNVTYNATSCPVITSPGTYLQPSDYTGAPNDASEMPSPGAACVKIAASNVVYDCNGHTITNDYMFTDRYGILLNGSLTNVTVQNCPLISNYTYNVYVYQSNDSVFTNITEVSAGFYSGTWGISLDSSNQNTISNSIFDNNSVFGILLSSSNQTNLSNDHADNNQIGIYNGGSQNILVNNTADNNENFGILDYAQNALYNNTAAENGYSDFGVYPGSVEDCQNTTVLNNTGSAGRPIYYSSEPVSWDGLDAAEIILCGADGSNITDSVVSGSDTLNNDGLFMEFTNDTTIANTTSYGNSYGFLMSDDSNCTFLDDTADNSGFDGFNVQDSNAITYLNGIANNNSGAGFHITNSTALNLTNNTAAGDIADGFYIDIDPASGSSFVSNTADNSSWAGIYVADTYAGDNASPNLFSGNVMCNNSFDGLQSWSPNSTFTNNLACGNGRYGFYIVNAANNTFINNSASNNSNAGLLIERSDQTSVQGMYFSNNSQDMQVQDDSGSPMTINLSGLVFDNPLGGLENYTNLSINDSVDPGEEYSINWTSNSSALLPGEDSFARTFVNITNLSSTMSIDSIVWSWTDDQVAEGGYTPGRFGLWGLNDSGWTLLNDTPDTSANTLGLTNLGQAGAYGIFESFQECPVISTSGTFSPMNNLFGAPNDASEMAEGGTACVEINSSDVVFDCNGYNITMDAPAGPTTYGIAVFPSLTNVTIQNCPNISGYGHGIDMESATYSVITNVTVTNSYEWSGTIAGIMLNHGSNNNLTDNNLSNDYNDILINASTDDLVSGNVFQSYGNGIVLYSSDNNVLHDNIAYNISSNGISLQSSDNNTIYNNTANNCNTGISIYGSSLNTVYNNTAMENSNLDLDVTPSNPNPPYNWDVSYCQNNITDLIGSGYRPVYYSDEPVPWDGLDAAEIELCGASGSTVTNSIVNGSDTLYNNAFLMYLTNDSLVANVSSSFNARGFVTDYVNNVTYTNDVADNDSYAGFIIITSSAISLINNSVINVGSDGIYANELSNSSFINNTIAHSNSEGIYVYDGNQTVISGNNLSNIFYSNLELSGSFSSDATDNIIDCRVAYFNTSSWLGLSVESSNDTFLRNNSVSNCANGLTIQYSDQTVVQGQYLSNNTNDLVVGGSGSPITLNLSGIIFDNPMGNMENFTNLSINDTMDDGEVYVINWSGIPAALPPSYNSFAQKFVDISVVSGNVSIDSTVWSWNGSELNGYDQTRFELWNYNGSWSDTGAALDTVAGTLSLANLNPAGTYGILQHQTTLAVDLMSPAGGYASNTASVNFTFNATGATSTMNCSLYLDGSLNQTNETTANDTATAFQALDIPAGQHNWSVSCMDGVSNTGTSETRSFSVSTTGPTVSPISPIANLNTSATSLVFTFNETDPVYTSVSCDLTIDGSVVNSTTATNASLTSMGYSPLGQGVHRWNVSCTNAADNTGTSATRNLTVDTTVPTIILNSPANQSPSGSSTVSFNFTAQDNLARKMSCSLFIDDALALVHPATNNDTATVLTGNGIDDGDHTWYVQCTDNANNTGTSETRSFSVVTTFPSVVLNSPANDFITSSTALDFSFNETDPVYANASCSLIMDGTAVNSTTATNDTETILGHSGLVGGPHSWSVSCTNAANNTAVSETWNFTVTTIGPAIILVSPASGLNTSSTALDFIFNETDPVYATVPCNLTVDGSVVNSTTAANSTLADMGYSPLDEGTHTWNVSCVDDADNSGTSLTRSFTVDTTAPSVSLDSPDNQSISSSSSVAFNFTPTDNLAQTMSCSIFLDDVLNQSKASANGTETTFTISGIADGDHTWYVQCTDNANNTDTSETRDLSVIITSPTVTLISPASGNITSATSLNFIFNETDPVYPSVSCDLTIDGTVRNSTTATNGSLTTLGYSGLGAGIHYWNVSCTNAVNNTGISETWSFIVSTTGPTVSLVSPINGLNTSATALNFTFNETDPAFTNASCNLTVDGSVVNSTTATNSSLTTLGYNVTSQGAHRWNVSCTNAANHPGNSTTRNFTVDTTPPTIALNSPSNQSQLGSSTVSFNFTAQDNLASKMSCSIFIDDALALVHPATNNNTATVLTTGSIDDGDHTWYVACTDNANNTGTSETRSFSVVSTSPTVYLASPISGFITNATSLSFTFNETDPVYATVPCNLTIDGTIRNSTTATNDTPATLGVSGISQGTHNWNVTCTNAANNTATSATWSFTSAPAAPTVYLISPVSGLNTSSTALNFVFNETDPVFATAACNLSVDGSAVNSTTANNSTATTLGYTAAEGAHNWSVTCTNAANDTAISAPRGFMVDTEPPNVTLNSPANQSIYTSSTVAFNFTAIDNLASTMNCSLYLDNVLNRTNVSVLNNTATLFTVSNMSDGNHTWYVSCTDNAGNANTSETRIFTAATSVPSVSLVSPINGLNTSSTSLNFTFNETDSLFATAACNLSIDGSAVNSTTANNSTATTLGYTAAEGAHSWNVSCTNAANHTGTSAPRSFTVDVTEPTVSPSSPADQSLYNKSTITFNFTATDNLASKMGCSLYLDGDSNATNASVSNHTATLFTVSNITDGSHTWYVSCTDNAGNNGTSGNRSFTVVTTAPTVTLSSPASGNITTAKSINFTFNETDPVFTNASCSLSVDGAVRNSTIAANNTLTGLGYSGLADGAHNWSVSCTDGANNTNASVTWLFTVTTIAPMISLVSPANGINISAATLNFSFIETDTVYPTASCNLTVDGSFRASTAALNDTLATVSYSGLPDGLHYWNISCVDSSNNANTSATRSFTLDTTPPSVSLNSPANLAPVNSSTVAFNFTAQDNLAQKMSCSLFLDSAPNRTNSSVSNNTATVFNVSGITDGSHTWYVNCTDNANNSNVSATGNFSVVTTAPTVVLDSPTSGINTSSNSLGFTFNETDPVYPNASCNLSIDGTIRNSTTATNNTPTTLGYSGLSDGTHHWNVTCRDAANNANASATWNFTVITTAPTVVLNSPIPGLNTSSTALNFNFTETDPIYPGAACNLSVDGSVVNSTTATNSTPATLGDSPLAQGLHTWSVSCADGINNANTSATRSFTVDTTAPTVNLATPANQSLYNMTTLAFNFTAQDNLAPVMSCSIYIDNVLNRTSSAINNTPASFTIISIADGTYTWYVACTDNANNTNTSENRTFSVVTTAPTVNLSSPISGFTTSSTSLNFTFNETDPVFANASCNLSIDGTVRNSTTATNNTPTTMGYSGIGDGNHNWSVTCRNAANNTATSATWNFTLVSTFPAVVLVSPISGLNTSSTALSFTFNMTDHFYTNASCNLTVDGSVANSTTATNSSLTSMGDSPLGQGIHYWNVTCVNGANNANTSATRSFTVDTAPPTVNLTSPANQSLFNSSAVSFYFNATDNLASAMNCSLYIDNAFSQYAPTANNTQTILSANGIGDGSHTWYVACTDNAGNNGTSETRTFTVVTSGPSVAPQSPADGLNTSATAISFSFIETDVFPNASCNLRIDGTSRNSTTASNNTLTTMSYSGLLSGPHTWSVSCTNGANNTGTSGPRSFIVGTTAATVILSSPPTGLNTSSTSLPFVFIETDVFPTETCNLSIDGTVRNSTTATNGSLTTMGYSPLSQGAHSWNVSCVNPVSFVGKSLTRTFTVDLTPPNVTPNSPANLSVFNSATVVFNFTAVDNMALRMSCSIYIDGSLGQTNFLTANNTPTLFTIGSIDDGSHTWYVVCTDNAGNNGTSVARNLTVDTAAPTVTLVSPANNNITSVTALNFTFNETDPVYPNASCNLTIDGTVRNSTTATNGSLITLGYSGLGQAVHYWNVTCTNAANNTNTSATNSFTVATTPPLVVPSSPVMGLNTSATALNFAFNETDVFASAVCNLTINGIPVNSTTALNNTLTTLGYSGLGEGAYSWNVSCIDAANHTGTSATRSFTVDTEPPNVTLSSPANQSISTSTTVAFNFTATDNLASTTNCSIYLDNHLNRTNASVLNSTPTLFTISNITDASHAWYVVCTDSAGNIGTSQVWNFTLVSTLPSVVLVSPISGLNTSSTALSFTFNVTDHFYTNASCNLTVDGSVANSTTAANSSLTSMGDSPLGQGIHYWNVTCMDPANNTNTSAARSFTVDTTAPGVALNSPYNLSLLNSATVSFNFTATDNLANATNCSIYLDNVQNSTNPSVLNSTPTLFTISNITDGNHTWYVACTDNAGNTGPSAAWNFTIVTTAPTVVLNSPANNNITTATSLDFSFNETDPVYPTASCNLTMDGYQVNSTTATNSVPADMGDSGLVGGPHTWSVSCTDAANNTGTSPPWGFAVATVGPTVILVSPPMGINTSSAALGFTFNETDQFFASASCNLSIDGSVVNSTTASNDTLTTLGYSGLGEGLHYWNVSCVDGAPYVGSSLTKTFTVDLTPPSVTLSSPANLSLLDSSTVAFNFTATDNLATTMNCSVFIDGAQNTSDPSVLNDTGTTITASDIADGSHTWYVACTDNAGNTGASDTWYFNSSTLLPNIGQLSPPNGAIYSSSAPIDVTFNFTAVDPPSPELNCSLYLDAAPEYNNGSVLSGTPDQSVLSAAVGAHVWRVTCTDIYGNTNSSPNYGFTISAPAPSPSPPPSYGGGGGGGGGFASVQYTQPSLLLSYSMAPCPSDEVTVTSSTSGVDVKLVLTKPYEGTLYSQTTGSDDTTVFHLAANGSYEIDASKQGYRSGVNNFTYTTCAAAAPANVTTPVTPIPPPPQVNCTSDAQCPSTYYCNTTVATCEPAMSSCGYAENHVWHQYQCCADTDCKQGQFCVANSCDVPNITGGNEGPSSQGVILLTVGGFPLANATLQIYGPNGTSSQVTTDANGEAMLSFQLQGYYMVDVAHGGTSATLLLNMSAQPPSSQSAQSTAQAQPQSPGLESYWWMPVLISAAMVLAFLAYEFLTAGRPPRKPWHTRQSPPAAPPQNPPPA